MAEAASVPLVALTAWQALVELSLCAGFLCLMLLAVWQVGTVFSNYIDLSEAAREGIAAFRDRRPPFWAR